MTLSGRFLDSMGQHSELPIELSYEIELMKTLDEADARNGMRKSHEKVRV